MRLDLVEELEEENKGLLVHFYILLYLGETFKDFLPSHVRIKFSKNPCQIVNVPLDSLVLFLTYFFIGYLLSLLVRFENLKCHFGVLVISALMMD